MLEIMYIQIPLDVLKLLEYARPVGTSAMFFKYQVFDTLIFKAPHSLRARP